MSISADRRHVHHLPAPGSGYAQKSAREIGDLSGEGNALGNLGLTYARLGPVQEAIDCHEQSLEIARAIGDRFSEGNRLNNLGNVYRRLGRLVEAIDHYQRALSIANDIGDRRCQGTRLANLGMAHKQLGEVEKARRCWRKALAILEEVQSPHGEKVQGWLAALDSDEELEKG